MNSKFNSKLLSMIVLIGLFSGTCFAQDNEIFKLTDRDKVANNVTSSKNNNIALNTSTLTTELPNDLLYDLKPSVFIKNNGILNVEGYEPVVLIFLDAQSFNFVSNRNPLYNKVEMITINLKSENDLANAFDVSSIRGFSHLKYIHLKCEFSITENQIRSFLKNADPEITFVYNIYQRS